MARNLSEIYASAKECRNQYLELTEFQNDSKMSLIDAFTWVVASCIFVFENLLDVFQVDVARELNNRINGTPGYYANALLKYQSGDELKMNAEGTLFSYPTIDESKRIITKVSYSEAQEGGYYDKTLVLKVATGTPGNYQRITPEELIKVQAYLHQIAFAGTSTKVVSRKGDVLIPRLTVYHDGAVSENEVYDNIEKALNSFIENASFNEAIYVQKIIDAIQGAEHVVDTYINTETSDAQGIFIAQYDDDDNLIPVKTNESGEVLSYEAAIVRYVTPNSGYIRQSTKTEAEANIPTWRESITLLLEE